VSSTIDNFYQRVSRAIRRRNIFDADIPGYAADAVRELENEHDWRHMKTTVGDQVLVVSATVNEIRPVITRVKNVRFIKLIGNAGDWVPLRKTQEENVLAITSGRPGAFWMKDADTIGLDAYPDFAYPYHMVYFRYSARPLENDLAWLTIAEDVLVARTLLKMQPLLRDEKLIQRWGLIESRAMPALLEAQVVSDYDGEDSQMIPFTMEVEEDIAEDVIFE
jgi:hypothetical protein